MGQCRYTWDGTFDEQSFARKSDATVAAALISRGFSDEDQGGIAIQVTAQTFPFLSRAIGISIMGAMVLPGIEKSR